MNEKKGIEKAEEFEQIRCQRCKSTFGYVKIKNNTWKCRKCNNEQELEE